MPTCMACGCFFVVGCLSCFPTNPILFHFFVPGLSVALQTWSRQPHYQEVNPKGTVILPCVIQGKKGECRWERDGIPIGIYPQKYEWSSTPETGDCSLKVTDASLEYDDGVWQCQVTPSTFNAKDALVSEGADLVVRGELQIT